MHLLLIVLKNTGTGIINVDKFKLLHLLNKVTIILFN